MFNFACKDTNNSLTTNFFLEFLYSLKWIFDHVVTPCLAPKITGSVLLIIFLR